MTETSLEAVVPTDSTPHLASLPLTRDDRRDKSDDSALPWPEAGVTHRLYVLAGGAVLQDWSSRTGAADWAH